MNFIDSIKDIDTQLFLFFNGKHNSFFDVLMFWSSHRFIWIPLYVFLFYLVYKQVGKKIWLIAITIALAIFFSDQLSVHAFKNVFLRYRPCHNLLIQSLVHVNGNCGGTYGFISSHAANTFALAMFLSLFFYQKIKYFTLLIFSWALFVSYSRIYNGVHYPADIAVGAIVGMGIGIGMFRLYQYANNKLTHE